MTLQILIQKVMSSGAWAKGNKFATVSHYFINKRPDMNTAISKCFGRVCLLSNLHTADDALECAECREVLELERMVEQLR